MATFPIKAASKYKCELTPFSQRLFYQDQENSKLLLTRASNFYLNSFTYGYDQDEKPFDGIDGVIPRKYEDRTECILDGFKTNITSLGSIITVTCSPGMCIIDTTLISILETMTLTIDLTNNYIDNGYLVLALSYAWVDSISLENTPTFKLFMVSSDGLSHTPTDINLFPNIDRLIISKFTFSFDSLNVSNIKNHYPIPIHKNIKEYILIHNTIYEICPLQNIIYETRNFIYTYITKKIIYNIDTVDKWIPASAPFTTDTPDAFSYSEIDISDINKKDCIVQCYINDMKIESACTQHISETNLRIWMPNWFTETLPLKIIKVVIIG